jgi:hypothetical protein
MKVGIQNKEGRLMLVWNDGKRRTMAILARALAEKTKAEIEWAIAKALGHSPRVLHDNYAEVIESRSVINTLELIQSTYSEGGDRE